MSPFRGAVLIGVLVMNGAHAGDTLGRLFLTPEQRHALDTLRDPNAPHPAADLTNNPLPTGMPVDRTVVMNGVVRRSQGPDVVWVNGTRANARPGQPVQVRRGPDRDNRVTLQNAEGTLVRLKPGQSWDPLTGRVADCYGCGSTRKRAELAAMPPAVTSADTPADTPVAAPVAAAAASAPVPVNPPPAARP